MSILAVARKLIAGIAVALWNPACSGSDTTDLMDRDIAIGSYDSHGPYCGVYAIVAASYAIGQEVELSRLWTPEVVSSRSGSNASDLLRGLAIAGLGGRCHVGLSSLDLAMSPNPLILHFRSVPAGRKYDHWVTFLGKSASGKFLIYDPRFPLIEMEPAMVLADWDGVAVEVYRHDGAMMSPYSGTVAVVSCFILVVSVLRFLAQAFSPNVPLVNQLVIMGLAIGASGIPLHLFSDTGILRNAIAVAAVKNRYFAAVFDEITTTELKRVIDATVTLVDARPERSFIRGSIPGALNLPFNASLAIQAKLVASLDKNSDVVVFCQSERCDYSDRIARFLKFCGFKNIRIYREGIAGWESADAES